MEMPMVIRSGMDIILTIKKIIINHIISSTDQSTITTNAIIVNRIDVTLTGLKSIISHIIIGTD
jgi:hypothetical protein